MSRADKLLTPRLIPAAEICIPESQKDQYAAHVDPERLICHPDSVIGLTAKWQWMLDNLMDDDALVFFDDDISHVIRLSSFSDELNKRILDRSVIYGIIEQVVSTARDMDAVLFGWNIMPHSIQFNTGFKPFELTGCVHGAAMGFLPNHNLSYNTEFLLKGDYWISLLNTYKNRYCLIDNRYAFAAEDTFVGEGGQSMHRTTEREMSELRLLQRFFGRDIVKSGHRKSRGRKHEYAGIESVQVSVPF